MKTEVATKDPNVLFVKYSGQAGTRIPGYLGKGMACRERLRKRKLLECLSGRNLRCLALTNLIHILLVHADTSFCSGYLKEQL